MNLLFNVTMNDSHGYSEWPKNYMDVEERHAVTGKKEHNLDNHIIIW